MLDLTQRVTCAIDPDTAFPAFFSGGVRVTLKDGRSLFRHVRVNSGAGERALDEAAVSEEIPRFRHPRYSTGSGRAHS